MPIGQLRDVVVKFNGLDYLSLSRIPPWAILARDNRNRLCSKGTDLIKYIYILHQMLHNNDTFSPQSHLNLAIQPLSTDIFLPQLSRT
jgi:hypothetical protein